MSQGKVVICQKRLNSIARIYQPLLLMNLELESQTIQVNSPPQVSQHDTAEISTSPFASFEQLWTEHGEQLRDEGLVTVDKLAKPLATRIREEFRACGVDEPSPELQETIEQLEVALSQARFGVQDKSARYQSLMRYSAGRTDIIAEELTERMTGALTDMSDQILQSDLMPEPPQGRFRRKEKETIYESWKSSKAKLIGRLLLPERDEILNDYYKSADAAFRRALFGSRRMRLDRGFDSDSIEEIDRFQRRFYDELGGYRIALTPREWVGKYLNNFVDQLLYDPDSETAQFLDGEARKHSPYAWEYSPREYRKTTNRRTQFDQARNGSMITDVPEVDIHTQVDESRPEAKLDEEQLVVFRDMQLLFDAELKNTPPTPAVRAKLMKAGCEVVESMELNSQGLVTNPSLYRDKLLRKMLVKFHPDTQGGDQELCKIISELIARLKPSQPEYEI